MQGGGCTTVGVAGPGPERRLRHFLEALRHGCASLIEAEVVTADGAVRIANAAPNPDLFWALKGGGGGSFGVVTRLTLRTHALPRMFGAVFGEIKAHRRGFRRADRSLLPSTAKPVQPALGRADHLSAARNVMQIDVFQGLDRPAAAAVWAPFFDWVRARSPKLSLRARLRSCGADAQGVLGPGIPAEHVPALCRRQPPGRPPRPSIWAGDAGQVARSCTPTVGVASRRVAWKDRTRVSLARWRSGALWKVSLHLNKGLAGATPR